MSKIFKYTILTVFAAIFLMPAFVSGQTENPGSAKGRTTDGTTRKTEDKQSQLEKPSQSEGAVELVFPDLENWQRGEVRTYPTEELGFSVPYLSREGGTVSIFVYNGGYSNIADGIGDKNVVGEFDRTKSKMVMLGEQGLYQGVKEVKSDTITLGGSNGKVKALHALYNFRLQGQEVDSEIFIFGYKGNFIKILATRPKAKNGAENQALVELLAAFDKMFAK